MSTPHETSEQRWRLPLIQTKMTPPRPPRGRVSRQALIERLSDDADVSLTVVIAPAGFGKTTLLAEWSELLRSAGNVLGWLSLDGEDDDGEQFGAYVVASLSCESAAVGRRAADLLRNDPMTPFKTVISVLLNEIAGCERQVYLILDDFDRLKSRSVRSIVTRLVRYAPPNFHVVVGVRSGPDLPVGQVRVQQQLRLEADDLRFTADEARHFFTQMGGVPLDRASVELLHGATEGWVAGLQMASLGMRQTGDAVRVACELASSGFGIGRYLEEAVLAQLPHQMIQFLLRTCVLDRLSARLCDALLGPGAHSWEKLNWLERNNVFIRALDAEHEWFRYHRLLSDVLRRRAEHQLASALPELHRRASQWFAAEQLWPEAVRHALAGGELQQAASFVEDCAMGLLERSDVRTLLAWIAKLPDELVQARVRLLFAKAWASALSLDFQGAATSLQALTSRISSHNDSNTPLVERLTLSAEFNAVSAVIAALTDDSPRALELGRIALEAASTSLPWVRHFAETTVMFGLAHDGQFEEVRRMQSSQLAVAAPRVDNPSVVLSDVYRTCMIGLNALAEGRLPEATRTYESALALAERTVGRDSAAAALPAGPLAALLYERNELTRSREVIAGRSAILMEGSPLGSLVRYCRASACLHARKGDFGSALTVLEEGRQIAAVRHWLRVRAGCDAESIRLFIQLGRVAQAKELGDELQDLMPIRLPSPMGSFFETWSSYCIARARVAMALGRMADVITMLEDLRGMLLAAGMQYLEASSSLLLAVALERSGARDSALKVLDRTLRYASPNRMISSFVDEGEPLLPLLLAARGNLSGDPAIEEFLAQLVGACAHVAIPAARSASAADVTRATCDLLRPREVEILVCISRGLSNKEVARALRVAPETIKWHLKNIFEKLDVGSRLEAVETGLGLCPMQQTQAGATVGAMARRGAYPVDGHERSR